MVNAIACTIELWYTREVAKQERSVRVAECDSSYLSAKQTSQVNQSNIFFDVDVWYKTNRNVVYRGLYSYRQRVCVINRFPNICSYCFCILNEFCKSF